MEVAMRVGWAALASLLWCVACARAAQPPPDPAERLQELRAQCQQASALWGEAEEYARQLPKHPERRFLAWNEADKTAWSVIASHAKYLVRHLQMATPQNPVVPYRNPEGIKEESVRGSE
jgi:hypothetical protein